MKRSEGLQLTETLILAAGLGSVVLGFLALNGPGSRASGDLSITSTTASPMTIWILLATFVLVGLALAHMTIRRHQLARLRRAAERDPA
jgi:hypothetical protein